MCAKINQALLDAPRGAVLTLRWLRTRGASTKLANYYVKSGWLRRIGEGAYSISAQPPDWQGAVFGLQQQHPNLHPGGRTALELAGLAHFLTFGPEAPIYLYGPTGKRLPKWFRDLPWASRVHHVPTTFLPADLGLRDHEAGGFLVRISAPERAILELLLQLPPDEDAYRHADLLFENLGTLRADLVQPLLTACSSVKVKRLFLHFAEKHGHPWFQGLDASQVDLGTGKRLFIRGGRLDPKYLITVPANRDVPPDAP